MVYGKARCCTCTEHLTKHETTAFRWPPSPSDPTRRPAGGCALNPYAQEKTKLPLDAHAHTHMHGCCVLRTRATMACGDKSPAVQSREQEARRPSPPCKVQLLTCKDPSRCLCRRRMHAMGAVQSTTCGAAKMSMCARPRLRPPNKPAGPHFFVASSFGYTILTLPLSVARAPVFAFLPFGTLRSPLLQSPLALGQTVMSPHLVRPKPTGTSRFLQRDDNGNLVKMSFDLHGR